MPAEIRTVRDQPWQKALYTLSHLTSPEMFHLLFRMGRFSETPVVSLETSKFTEFKAFSLEAVLLFLLFVSFFLFVCLLLLLFCKLMIKT